MNAIAVAKRLTGICAAAVALTVSSPVMARDFALLGGTSGSNKSQYSYLGLVVPVSMQSLDADGWLGRFWLSYQDFNYNKTPTQRIDVTGPAVEAAIGYQKFFSKDTRLTGYLGALHRNLDAKPDDPLTNVESKRSGAKAQVEFTTKFTQSFGLSGIASHVSGIDATWARLRPAWHINDYLNIGPEFVSSRGKDYNNSQVGLFVEGIRLGQQSQIGLKLGREHNGRGGGTSSTNADYAGVSFSVRF